MPLAGAIVSAPSEAAEAAGMFNATPAKPIAVASETMPAAITDLLRRTVVRVVVFAVSEMFTAGVTFSCGARTDLRTPARAGNTRRRQRQ